MSPFFSVIIPAYNAEDHIRPGLESIRTQTFTDYELIVVCDSCEDRTKEIAEEYGAITAETTYHLDGLTRNHGIEMAGGQWILFMDDDDWFLHEYVFQQLADMIAQHDGLDGIVFGHISAGKGYNQSSPDCVHVPVWTKCWRSGFLKQFKFSNRHYWSDCDLQNKVLAAPHKFLYWDMPLYYYNYRRIGSQTQRYEDGEVPKYAGKPPFVLLDDHHIGKGI